MTFEAPGRRCRRRIALALCKEGVATFFLFSLRVVFDEESISDGLEAQKILLFYEQWYVPCYLRIQGKNENSPSSVFSGAVATALIYRKAVNRKMAYIKILMKASNTQIREQCTFNINYTAKIINRVTVELILYFPAKPVGQNADYSWTGF